MLETAVEPSSLSPVLCSYVQRHMLTAACLVPLQNKLIMCIGCDRAYHVKCCKPPMAGSNFSLGMKHWSCVLLLTKSVNMMGLSLKVMVKVWTLVMAPLTRVRLATSSALQSSKWQLIGMSRWCRSALCGHPLPAVTDNWIHSGANRHTIAPISRTRPSPHSPQ